MAAIIDKIAGVFGKGKKEDVSSQERHSLLLSRLSVAKNFAKKPHKRWRRYASEYGIEDIEDVEHIKDEVRIGYLFRKTEADLPAIFETQPELFFKTRNKLMEVVQKPVESLYDYLWDIQGLEEVIEDATTYFLVLGHGYVKSPWVTKTRKVFEQVQEPRINPETGEPVVNLITGEPVMDVVDREYDVPVADNPTAYAPNPFKVFFSPETKFNAVLNNDNCPYYFEEMTMTAEEVKAKFNQEVEASEKLRLDDERKEDEDKDVSDTHLVHDDDVRRVTVYEYYGSLPEEVAPKGWEYDKCYRVYMTKSEELSCEESPYLTKPLLLLGNYGMPNRFYKFGDARHLIPLIQELESYRTQVLRHTRKMANPKILIPTTSNVDENAITDPRAGVVVKYDGAQPPTYLMPSQLGHEVSAGIQEARVDLEKTSGSFDLASGGGQSTVRTPRGISVFAEAAEKNIRRKRKKVARFIRHLILFQFAQVAENWDVNDPRVAEIITGGDQNLLPALQAVMEFLRDENLMAKLDVEIESLAINRVQQKQDALALWDQVKDRPDIFNLVEIGKDLLQNGYNKRDADRYMITPEQRMAMQQAQAQARALQQNETTQPQPTQGI